MSLDVAVRVDAGPLRVLCLCGRSPLFQASFQVCDDPILLQEMWVLARLLCVRNVGPVGACGCRASAVAMAGVSYALCAGRGMGSGMRGGRGVIGAPLASATTPWWVVTSESPWSRLRLPRSPWRRPPSPSPECSPRRNYWQRTWGLELCFLCSGWVLIATADRGWRRGGAWGGL